MAIQRNFPDEGPTLNLNFAGSRTLDPRITFTRTSSATYMGSGGLIKVAPANSPRFDHSYNPATGEIESLGLLIEEQRENLITWSEEFIGAYWVLARATTSENSQIAPNGINDAYSLIEDLTPSNTHSISESITFTAVTHTFSCYAKANQRSRIRLLVFDGVTSFGAYFNLLTGNIDTISSNTQASTTLLPGGWVRCSVTCTTTAGTGSVQIRLAPVTGNDVYTGDGTSGIYIWGAQLEIGSFPTSYIPTSGSTATRTADNASMTGSNFTSWYNQSEGTIYVSQKLIAVQNTIRNNIVYLINGGSGSDLFYNVNHGITNIFVFGDGETNYSRWQENGDSTDTKAIWAYDVSGDDFKPYWNGIEGVNETTTNTPSATSHTKLDIGASIVDKYTGHISQLTYYPTRLPNSQLQVLTR